MHSAEQMAAVIRALEKAKAGYASPRSVSEYERFFLSEYERQFYLGKRHGMQHAIDIVRRAVPLAGRGDA